MVIKYGKYGKFLACPGYPECQNAKPYIETIDEPCPKCGGKVQIRKTKREEIIIYVRTIQTTDATTYLGQNQ